MVVMQNVNAKQDLAKHAVTLLLFFSKLEDLKRQGLAAILEDVTCTGMLQLWHVPPKRDIQAAAIKDITFPKACPKSGLL